MRVIAKRTVREFWQKHPNSEQTLRSWYADVSNSTWIGPADIKQRYASASFLANNRIVFNIKGNKYRIVVKVNYDFKLVYIRFVGTHAEYDKIEADKI